MNCFNTECSICFETPKNDSIIVTTDCNHFICIKCFCVGGFDIRKCPICRHKLKKAFVISIGSEEILYRIGKDHHCPHCIMKIYNPKLTHDH